jgi:hypothetical protein
VALADGISGAFIGSLVWVLQRGFPAMLEFAANELAAAYRIRTGRKIGSAACPPWKCVPILLNSDRMTASRYWAVSEGTAVGANIGDCEAQPPT